MSRKKRFDREIMRRLQSVEHEIPPDLEQDFLKALSRIEPEPGKPRERPVFYYGALAAAAAVLLVLLLFLFPVFHRPIDTAEADEVWVQDARVEGKPATTVVVNSTNPDITIVWIEKIAEK